MKLSDICIRQPVLATVLSLVLVVIGVLGFKTLSVRFFPKVVVPVVYVTTSFPGASATLMENEVTTPLENAIASVAGVQSVRSSSQGAYSRIVVLFHLGGNLSAEAAALRDVISGAMQNLPPDIVPPNVVIGALGSPVINYGLTQSGKTSAQIRDYVVHHIVPQLNELPGVGSVYVNGAWGYAMRVWLNAAKMAALGITVSDIQSAIDANNIFFPAGSFRTHNRVYTVVSDTQLKTAKQFGHIIIRHTAVSTVRLSDVATVKLGFTTPFPTPLYLNGHEGVVLNVQPLQGVSPILVANAVKREMARIMPTLPATMKAKIIYDKSIFLAHAIHAGVLAIVEAIVLVVLIVLFFLGSFRAALIPIVTIPVSLIAVFFLLRLFNFSVNTLSILGMILAIGLVVDDAIVMVENIHRHMVSGVSGIQAALIGSREIAVPVILMAVTLAAVYAPIGFASGYSAKLFQQFALTLAGAVLISAFVALTLSPMMCSKLLQPEGESASTSRRLRFFVCLEGYYQRLLVRVLSAKRWVLLAVVCVVLLGVALFKVMPATFLPSEDYGLFRMNVSTPAGSTAAYVGHYLSMIKQEVKNIPAIKGFGYQLLNNGMLSFFTLKPWEKRHQSVQAIVKQLNRSFAAIPGITVTANVPPVMSFGGTQGSGLIMNLMTTGSYRDLLPAVSRLEVLLKNYPGLTQINSSLKFNAEQYKLHINRDLAAESGVSIQDIADTVHTLMSGEHWTNVQSNANLYQVLVQMRRQDMLGFNSLDKLYVKSSSAVGKAAGSQMVPLSSLIQLTPSVGQSVLYHYNRMRSAQVSAQLLPGYTMSDVLQYVQQHVKTVLPKTPYAYSGAAKQYLQSRGNMGEIFLLSFVFIYLVLSAQFGSFIDPFIILFAVPLSIVGAMLFLYLGGGSLNLYADIGLITLVGLISKHGILLTQFINNKRREGLALNQAIISAASIRLRPILMTTAAMIFGTLPLLFSQGPGSNGSEQIGLIIVGGLLCGTCFSLILVPVAYAILGRFKRFEGAPGNK